jgi:hypothetical protein
LASGTIGARSLHFAAVEWPKFGPPSTLKRAGCNGIQVAFFDFAPDLEFFGEAVLPLMYQAGLRI